MKDMIKEYKQSLRKLRSGKVVPLHRSSMISDTEFAIEYMETGQMPGAKWTVARWSKLDREVFFDPVVLDKCFALPSTTNAEISDGISDMLDHLLSCLSQREREAFILVNGQGFSHSEAAEYMGLSRGNIYNLLKRSEKKFGSYRQFVGQKQTNSEGYCQI